MNSFHALHRLVFSIPLMDFRRVLARIFQLNLFGGRDWQYPAAVVGTLFDESR